MTNPDLHHTAIHEAGHAVAFLLLFPNCYGDQVTIVPDNNGNLGLFSAEDVSVVEIDTPEEEAIDMFQRHAAYCCAGYAALIVRGKPEDIAVLGCEIDFEQAGTYLDEGKARAIELLSSPVNIKAVEHIANELLRVKTLGWEHIQMHYSLAIGEMTEAEFDQWVQLTRAFEEA